MDGSRIMVNAIVEGSFTTKNKNQLKFSFNYGALAMEGKGGEGVYIRTIRCLGVPFGNVMGLPSSPFRAAAQKAWVAVRKRRALWGR